MKLELFEESCKTTATNRVTGSQAIVTAEAITRWTTLMLKVKVDLVPTLQVTACQ